jgi:hypothetical protein
VYDQSQHVRLRFTLSGHIVDRNVGIDDLGVLGRDPLVGLGLHLAEIIPVIAGSRENLDGHVTLSWEKLF